MAIIEALPDVAPDWSPNITPNADVINVKYGDGYEQRMPNGIHYIKHTASLSWSNIRKYDFDRLYPFLFKRLGLTPFFWTAPDEDRPRKWKCTGVSKQQINAVFYTVSASFEEVVE